MFKSDIVVPAYANLIGWKQHYNTGEINLPESLTNTDTGEYYQQKHAALQLDVIQSTLPSNYDLDIYLRDKITDSTNEIFNDLLQYRKVNEYGKTLLEQSVLLNKYGWKNDIITNQNRFVGYQIRVMAATGLQAVINQIGLQFVGVESFKLYLFHSSQSSPLKEIDVTTTGSASWDWSNQDLELSSFVSDEYQGGVFVLGYYQEDLVSNAINYTNFNWDRGECGSCGGSYSGIWQSIGKYYHVYPIYVPDGAYTKGEMFDLNDAIYCNSESYGLNLKLSVRCDLTDFFIQNKFVFKNLLGYKVVSQVLNDMKFSQQINYIEENIKNMIIRDLEGDIETNLTNIPSLYNKELMSVSFDTSSLNNSCLGCKEESFAPTYGVM